MSRVQPNFRGLKALVLQSDVTGRDKLIATLSKLGMVVTARDHDDLERADLADADIIFVDADEGSEPILSDFERPDVPLVAIVGSEAPSRLSRVVRVRAESHILKPIRNAGIFTAAVLAINEHALRQRSVQEAEALRRRLAGRRQVVKAVLALMRRWGVDEDAAYQRLRSEAMHHRIPVEEAASRVLTVPCDDPASRRSVNAPD